MTSNRLICVLGFCAALVALEMSAMAGPVVSVDTNPVTVLCPAGSVVTHVLNIVNSGDAALTWTASERYEGTNFTSIVRQFKSGWTKYGVSPSLEYDATNDCLWTADYSGGSELAQLSTANGSVVATKSMGTNSTCILGGLKMDGTNLWVASYSPKMFQRFRLSDMGLLQSVAVPSAWTYACSFAIGEGKWWSTKYDNMVSRLNPTDGTVVNSFTSPDYMGYTKHMGYRDGSLWWGSGESRYYNVLRRMDANSGLQQAQIQIGQFYSGCTIHDVSFQTDTQVWVLTYQHLVGTNQYWAHLVDISGAQRFSKSSVSGNVPAGASAPLSLVLNGVGATLGLYPVRMTVTSNGGGAQGKLVTFLVHAPGANRAPVANAGPDQSLEAVEATTPVTLYGSGSSDPDGDVLRYAWSKGGVVFANVANPVLSLAPGVHEFALTVDDYRGGVSTDSVRITINAPDISFAQDPVDVLCPQGSVVTQTVTVLNVGTRPLNWTMTDHMDGTNWVKILRSFKVGWNLNATGMKYDVTNNCLWAAYYYSNEVAKLSVADGSVLVRKYLPAGSKPYGIEMEGTNLWVADYTANNFRLYNLSNMSVVKTVAQPSGWTYRTYGMAIGGGNWYATTSATNVYRLDPNTGAVVATYPTPDYFSNSGRHIGYGEGSLWWGRGTLPYNVLRRMDATSGEVKSTVQVGSWYAGTAFYDLSYAGSNGQYWVSTYYHNGATEYWIHLLDLSTVTRLTDSPRSGSIAAGGSATIQVTFDGRGVARGAYPVQMVFQSNDPEHLLATNTVMVIVHAPGVNHPPVANAGPDRAQGIFDPTAPFIPDLSGFRSSDPDGDPLRYRWTTNGVPVVANQYGLVELAAGVQTFTLTVDDYRGGTNTDSMVFCVTNKPLTEWPEWYGPEGSGRTYETNWFLNWPPVVEWRRPGIGSGEGSTAVSDGRVYHFGGNEGLYCLDALTGATIWNCNLYGYASTPAVDEDRVYVGVGYTGAGNRFTSAKLYALDKRTGSNLWTSVVSSSQYHENWGYYNSAAVFGDIVYLDGTALNKRTGAKLWTTSSTSFGASLCKRFAWNSHTYFLDKGYLIDPLTGANAKFIGGTYMGSWLDATTTYGTDKVWRISSLTQIDGGTLWSTNVDYHGPELYEMPKVVGDYGYFNVGGHGGGGTRICQDLKTGKILWSQGAWNTWIVAGDKLIGLNGSGQVGVIRTGATNYIEDGPVYTYDAAGGNYWGLPAFANQRIYLKGASGLACLYTGLHAPVLGSGAGSWNEQTAIGSLNGYMVNTGGAPTQVWIYWGAADGQTNGSGWQHCEPLGVKPNGPFAKELSGLASNTVYFYRCFASNGVGSTWGPNTERLVTYGYGGWDRDRLQVHWPCDETNGLTLWDASGDANHGTISGPGPVVWTTGCLGNGLQLAGTWPTTYATSGPFSSGVGGDLTLAGWVNYASCGSGTEGLGLFSLQEMETATDFGLGFKIQPSAGGRVSFGSACLTNSYHDGQWHHLVGTRSGTNLAFYVDGMLMGAGTVDHVASYCRLRLMMGAPTTTFDDIRVYRRALSAAEVFGLYDMKSPGGTPMNSAIAAGADDAEELMDGTVTVDSADLEMPAVNGTNQTVGMRFTRVNLPYGAVVRNAAIQFRASSTQSNTTYLSIRGEASDNAATFAATKSNLNSRTKTQTAVFWSVGAWTAGDRGPAQCTPELREIVEEVVRRPGWTSGNALAFFLGGVGGSGQRVANAVEKAGGVAASLRIVYGTNRYPVASFATAPVNGYAPLAVQFDASASSDPDGDGLIHSWTFGDGHVGIGRTTSHVYQNPGTYNAVLTVDDGRGGTNTRGMEIRVAEAGESLFVTWNKKMTIGLPGYGRSEVLSNFPVLVVLNTNLTGFAYSHFTSPQGWDLRFEDTNRNELAYEIESWDTNGSSCVWVRVPALGGTVTVVTAYWGGPTDARMSYTTNGEVWASGYVGVWHMNSTNGLESGTNRCILTSVGNTNVAGLVAGAQGFNGASAYMTRITDMPEVTRSFTVSAWLRPNASQSSPYTTIMNYYSDSYAFIWQDWNGTLNNIVAYRNKTSGGGAGPSMSLTSNVWQHVGWIWDTVSGNVHWHKNGAQTLWATGRTAEEPDMRGNIRIGARRDGYYYGGLIDEVRVSAVARSTNWVWAEYMNMASNGLFNSYGSVAAGGTRRTPAFLSAPETSAMTGNPYSYYIATVGVPEPDIAVTGLPGWLTLSGSLISGTPTTAGTYGPITIVATNGVLPNATQTFSIVVMDAVQTAPTISSMAPAYGTVGAEYLYRIAATGAPMPGFAVSGHPGWLTLAGKTLRGTPTVAGTYGPITVTATNGVAPAATQTLSITVTGCASDEWPQWRGPNRDGVFTGRFDIAAWPPPVVWSNTIEKAESGVVLSGGRLYTMGRRQYGSAFSNLVYCLDADTGTSIWTRVYPASVTSFGYGPQATPSVAGNELYTFDDMGNLYCFDKVTGATLWNIPVDLCKPTYGYSGSPLVEGDLVILNACGTAAAVSRTTHQKVWPSATFGVATYASPAVLTVGGKRLILTHTDNALNAVDPVDGSLAWSHSYDSTYMGYGAGSDPVVMGDKVFLYENGMAVVRASTSNATEVVPLNTDNGGSLFATPVAMGGYIYALNNAGELVRANPLDGGTDWNVSISASARGNLVAAGGRLIVLADGALRVVKVGADGFDEEGRTPVTVATADLVNYGWTLPAVYRGRVYCRVGRVLTCFQMTAKSGTDRDGNQIDDGWEWVHFGTNGHSLAWYRADDRDGDGARDWDEYVAGTNPNDAGSCLTAAVGGMSANGIVIRWPSVADRSYEVYRATNLIQGFDVWIGTNLPATPPMNVHTDRTSSECNFYRIEVK